MSLVEKLYKSRRYEYERDLQGGILQITRHFASPMVDLVQSLEQECFKQQLTLSRWETSSRRSSWVKTITWAIHEGERPARSDQLPTCWRIILHQVEGTTEKCIAYRELSAMLERLVNGGHKDS